MVSFLVSRLIMPFLIILMMPIIQFTNFFGSGKVPSEFVVCYGSLVTKSFSQTMKGSIDICHRITFVQFMVVSLKISSMLSRTVAWHRLVDPRRWDFLLLEP